MSSCSYIALLINRERGAHNNEKENDYQRANGYLQSKRHKRRNFLYTFIVLVITVVLLIFAIRAVKVEPVEAMPHSGNSIRNTYLGNITLNNDIRKSQFK